MKASEAVPYSFNLHSLRPALTIAVRTSLLFKLVVTRSATGPLPTLAGVSDVAVRLVEGDINVLCVDTELALTPPTFLPLQ